MTDTILSKDTIHIEIGDDHSYNCNTVAIGRAGENAITQLEITIPEELNTFWAYLDFKKPKGDKYKTPRLAIENNVIEYDIPIGLINETGNLEVQLVLQNENGEIWKSSVKKYVILKSIDAVDDIPFQEDFITEAQALLDSVAIDQTYDPESENGLSGKAVAEAVSETAPAIKNTLKGEVLTVNDVSPLEHSLKVNVESKNLFNGLMEQGSFDTTTGEELTTDSNKNIRARSVGYIQVSKGTYTLSTAENWWFVLYVYDINGNYIANESKIDWWSSNIYTFTILGDRLIKFGMRRADNATFLISDIKWVQLEFGSTATEYTPYDVNGVKISRYGKNLLDLSEFITGKDWNNNSNPSMAHIDFSCKPNTEYSISWDNSYKGKVLFVIEKTAVGSSVSNGTHDVSYREVFYLTTKSNTNCLCVLIQDTNYVGTIDVDFIKGSNLQIELGKAVTSHEPYKESQTATANTDGTVNGLTSISPNMTLVTDTNGVLINCEYNADTKMYIDNKFAELQALYLEG